MVFGSVFEDFSDGKTGITVTLDFSYSTGGNINSSLYPGDDSNECFEGELREEVQTLRELTQQQVVILDKIKCVHVFFKNLEGVCSSVKEVRSFSLHTIFFALTVITDSPIYRGRV